MRSVSTDDSEPAGALPDPPDDKTAADRLLDFELEQTFPASDALPWIHEAGADARRRRSGSAPLRYLDDFSPGQRFVTGTATVLADDIKAFAARFDPQPFHLDEAAAAQSVFGGLTASGWHTAAMSMRLLVDGDLRVAGGLVGVGGEMTWHKPVRPGDVLRVVSEVLDVRPSRSKPDRGIVTVRNETLNQRDEAVQVGVMKLVVPRKPGWPNPR